MLEKVSMAKGGDYDVVIADDYIIEKIVEEGLATKLDKDKISNWGNINPLYQGQFYDEKDEYTVPYGAGIPLIVYDPGRRLILTLRAILICGIRLWRTA